MRVTLDSVKEFRKGDPVTGTGKWADIDQNRDNIAASRNVVTEVNVDGSGIFLIEVVLKTKPGLTKGGIVSKCSRSGYVLEVAETTIEELYKWEFDGPFLKDFHGRPVQGTCRDAGAVEYGKDH